MTPFQSIRELGCPPGFPPDIQGWHSDHDFFRQAVAETKPSVIIEVGTWKGASCLTFSRLTEESQAQIYCCDTWLGGYEMLIHDELPECNLKSCFGYPQIYFQFLANLSPTDAAKRIFPIPQTSVNGARLLKAHGVTAELIYIDASHQLQDVYDDLCAYWPLLKSGGMLFGDDFELSGVEVSVKRFSMEHDLQTEIIDGIFWVLRKV